MKRFLFFVASILGILGGKASIYDNEINNSEYGSVQVDGRFGFNLNTIVDGLLVATRAAIVAAGDDTIPLDDFGTDFDISLKIATIKAHLQLVNGTLQSLSSIQRIGDAKFIPRIDKREFDVKATLGLETAIAEYYYLLKILGTHPNGNMTAVIGNNALEVTLAASLNSRGCHLQLSELKMTTLANINVTLTGLYPFDTLSSRFATHIVKGMTDVIADNVVSALRYHIESELRKIPCPGN